MFDKNDRVLCIAPHADDETIGCGGTIAKLREQGINVLVYIVTGPGDSTHPIFVNETWERVRKEFQLAIKEIGSPSYIYGNLPAALLDQVPTYEINKDIQNIINDYKPNLILSPSPKDLHIDHQIINYAVRVASRPYLEENELIKSLLEYETLSESGIYTHSTKNLFCPSLYIDISNKMEAKVSAFKKYTSQEQKGTQPRNIEGIKSLAKYRGMNINKAYAEAFELIYHKI